MLFYAITYDLRQPGRKYDELYEGIKNLVGDGNWQHPMESFWVLSISSYSTITADQIYTNLRQFIDDNDSLFVTIIDEKAHQGWMPKNFWDWFISKRSQL